MPGFRLLEHTADAGVVAYGRDLKEAFAGAARGLFSIVADLRGVRAEVCREISVEAPDREALLVAWLNELIYLLDVERLLFRRFEISRLDAGRLEARAWGERIAPTRHRLKSAVKAATYHQLRVEEDEGRARVRVIFDL